MPLLPPNLNEGTPLSISRLRPATPVLQASVVDGDVRLRWTRPHTAKVTYIVERNGVTIAFIEALFE